MGAYIAIADLRDELGEDELIRLTDNANLGVVGEPRAIICISNAEGIINGYLGGRYPIPLSPVTDFIKAIARSIAIYELYKDRAEFVEGKYDVRMKSYDRSINLLKEIQRGVMIIEGVEPLPVIVRGGRRSGGASSSVRSPGSW